MYNSIHHSETIVNILEKINLTDKFSKIVLTHIITILVSIFSIGYRGKTVDFETHSNCHRTTIAHFLNNGKWDESILENVIKQCVIKTIYNESKRSGKPVLCMIDDTISSKTKPSSKAKNPINYAYFHCS